VKKDCDFINCEELNNSDTLFKVLNFLKNKELDSLSFDANGEIFIHYYRLIDFLSGLSTNNFKKLSFITNGTLLDVERIYRLKQISYQTGIGYNFIVSLDGCTKETYEATRPGANFEKVIETIHNLLKYFNVEIIFTIKKTNLQDADKIENFTFTLDTLKYLLINFKNKFITKEEMNNKVDKVEGKELSSNNFSDEDANNINNSFDDTEVVDNVSSELTTLKFYSGSNETKTIDLDI
jgi:sulfatase maturation enzyme AslB (radical SAM superfamily)